MLLAIDVGNTHTVLGLYREAELIAHWRIATRAEPTDDELGVLVRALFAHHPAVGQVAAAPHWGVTAAILSSVVPPLTETLVRMAEKSFGARCRVVGPGLKTGMPILYDNPREVGADRIVNAVAGFERFACGLIIVDFGTATTFDVVGADGAYEGGVIAPGVNLSLKALEDAATALPQIDVSRPAQVIGRNTVDCMQSGIYWGYVGLVEGICARIREERGRPMKVIATGGLSPLFARGTDVFDAVDGDLTLRGLAAIYQLNRQEKVS